VSATGATLAGPPAAGAALAPPPARGTTLTGTWALVRFILRRDRVRLVVWIAGITLLVLSTAASVEGLYPTQADLDKAAQTANDNAALIALNAPSYALDTLGGQAVFNVGSFGYVVMALMGMFLVGRHTRADEEAGRTELLRATVLGRNAPVTAVLVVAAGAFAVLGGLITLSMLSQDLPTAGSVLYGVAMGPSACCSPASPRSRSSSPSTTAPRSGSPARCSAPPTSCGRSATSATAPCRGRRRWGGPKPPGRTPGSAGGRCCC
jgi:hypothetical protein